MTQVSIIEINLLEINTIINAEIQELSERSREDIQALLAERRAAAQVQQQRTAGQDEAAHKIELAYEQLLAAGATGVPAARMALLVAPMALSASTLRLKTFLRHHGNEWVLTKTRRDKQDYYVLLAYNQEPT